MTLYADESKYKVCMLSSFGIGSHPPLFTMKECDPQPGASILVEEKDLESPPLSPSKAFTGDVSNNNIPTTQDEATLAWRKMDCMVLPIVTSIFFLCFLVRFYVLLLRRKDTDT